MIVATAEVDIVARIDQLDTKLEKALGDAARKAGDSAERELGEKFRKIGSSMTKFVTLPVVGGFALAAKAASDLGEQTSKAGVVFGESADEVKAFAKTSAQSLGLSERAALEAAGTYGNLFRAIGLASDKSAEMSKKLVGLAADLASFNNANPEEVLDALRSGLTGEVEPLRKFGVNLNEVRIQQEALSLGLVKGKGPLDASAKAQASYSLILKDTALAQGDFSRTSGGLANQQRIVRAELENTAASIGQKLIPAALNIAHAISGVLSALNTLPAGVQSLALIGVTGLAVSGPIFTLVGNFTRLSAAIKGSSITLGGFTKAAGGITLVAAAAATAFLAFKHANEEADKLVKAATSGIKKNDLESQRVATNNLIEAATKANVAFEKAREGGSRFGNALAGTIEVLSPLKNKIADTDAALDKTSTAAIKAREKYDQLKGVFHDVGVVTGLTTVQIQALANSLGLDLQKSTDGARFKLIQAAEASHLAGGEAEDSARSNLVAAGSYDEVKKAIDAAKESTDKYLGIQLSFDEAQDKAVRSTDELIEKIKENGNVTDLTTAKTAEQREAILDNREAIRGSIEDRLDAQRAEEQQSGVALTTNQRLDRQRQFLMDLANQLSGPSRQSVLDYIKTLDGVPREVSTSVDADTTPAKLRLEELKAKFKELGQVLVGVGGNVSVVGANGGRIPLRMAGGLLDAGQLSIVNEAKNGGEFFFPQTAGRILSNADSRQALANAASGSSINVTFAPQISGGFADRQSLMSDLRNVIRTDLQIVLKNVVQTARAPAGSAA